MIEHIISWRHYIISGGRTWRMRSAQWPSSPRVAKPRVRSHCRLRTRGTECIRESGMKWANGSTKRQCERALPPPPPPGGVLPSTYAPGRRRRCLYPILVYMEDPCRDTKRPCGVAARPSPRRAAEAGARAEAVKGAALALAAPSPA